ncbi:MAG: hypothetical protein JOZ77_00620 [Candidatus Eremiobacteraeota bacterium]|nr:hypothetical protein [Candidatus Eremiobacteraeota bacterium]
MMTADLAFAMLINRTSAFYQANPPTYMTYIEHTHVSAPTLGRAQDIDRSIAVRIADNFAVMKDLPNGSERAGQAFPIVAYFDPLSNFKFGYFANLKRVDITLDRGAPFFLSIPGPDPGVNVVVPYNSYWAAHYASDSTDTAIHLLIDPTPRVAQGLYPSDVVEDGTSHLPSHIEMRVAGAGDESFSLDYSLLDGHWVIVHGTFSQTMHVAFLTYKIIADVTFHDIAFPSEPPDPRLAGTPAPSSAPSP